MSLTVIISIQLMTKINPIHLSELLKEAMLDQVKTKILSELKERNMSVLSHVWIQVAYGITDTNIC